ncbi:GNAT family N-acetyltransferase [Rickettsia asembonensis]|nr:GNAT family N-acetyltransferase [Rickettsia asembonensis]WCR55988.1 MAG: hypothetical protein PG979_000045 [Rickettsia asembonensis]
MTQGFEIVYAENMEEHYLQQIRLEIEKEAKNKKDFDKSIPFSFVCLDKKKNFIAGISGVSFYGALFVDVIGVSENFREKRYGTLLMEKAENLAKERNYKFIYLITMDFEAKPFYEKLGYKIEFAMHGYKKDSIMYYLRKNL